MIDEGRGCGPGSQEIKLGVGLEERILPSLDSLREKILEGSAYSYMGDLRTLQGRKGADRAPPEVAGVSTPLVVAEWRRCLANHPDREFVGYILQGLEEGFRLGFRYTGRSNKSAKSNMHSAAERPEVINSYLAKEVELGRVVGPLERSQFPEAHVSRFGLVPKNHQPDKWRLIVDLSHPAGASVNDGIEPEVCSMHYTSVAEAVEQVLERGAGTQLAKFDVESAYRNISVHPDDRMLLGMSWKDKLYVDTALPFGLRSAPKIFSAVADALQWILADQGVGSLHYLDDFILFGSPDSPECRQALEKALQICKRLGVPIAVHKTEGPATVLVFLGIEVDTVEGVIRLPEEKLRRLQREIRAWKGRRTCTKRELLSLIGQLQHACCVVKAGRTFLRRLISLSTVAKELYHRIRLNKGFRSDLQWWACFLPAWNGCSMLADTVRSVPSAVMTSDASGSWGSGAFTNQGEWFQLKWPESWASIHITVKELLPIVLGVALWGAQWTGTTVKCLCDNAAVVAILNSGRSKCDRVMHLMRCLFFFLARFRITLVGEHIPGVDNGAADALSRDRLSSFRVQVPQASEIPSPIHPGLIQALVVNQPDWTSRSWIELLKDIFHGGLHSPPGAPTRVPRKGS